MLPRILVFERKMIVGPHGWKMVWNRKWDVCHFLTVRENPCGSANKQKRYWCFFCLCPRPRSCSETYRMPVMEYKMNEGVSYEFKFPFRNNNKWQRNANKGPHSPQVPSQVQSPMTSRLNAGKADGKMPPPERAANIPRSISSDGRPLERRWVCLPRCALNLCPRFKYLQAEKYQCLSYPYFTRNQKLKLRCVH